MTESIKSEGLLIAFAICPSSGRLRELGRMSTHGRSACYITLSHDLSTLFLVNYWDSTMVTVPIGENGLFRSEDVKKITIPGENACGSRTAHGDDPHSSHRLKESHAHAVVLDPCYGRIVYVPDLGEGCIKQFGFSEKTGRLQFSGVISCGSRAAGPR